MTRTTGSGPFNLASVRNLRLRFENPAGTGSQQVFVDNFGAVTWTNSIQVSDGFDTGNNFGSSPAGWVVSAPAGTSVRCVDNTVTTPASSPYCVELADNGSAQQPEMYKNFASTPAGSATVSVKIPAADQAPLAVKLYTSSGQFLFRVVLSANGTAQYDGDGTNLVTTTVLWTPGIWQTVRVDWFMDGTFDAYLDGIQFANTVPFAGGAPGRLLLQGGFDTATGRVAYVDNLVVSRRVLLTARGLFKENAIWLSGNYRSDAFYISLVPALAQKMKTENKVLYWFVNMGSIASNGLIRAGTSYSQVANFLNGVKAFESQTGHRFVVTAWLNNGNLSPSSPDWLDVTQASIRSNIVGECKKFCSTNVPGTFIAGATRTFDGIHFDFEPSGADATRFNGLKQLMDETRAALASIGRPNGGHLSFASSRYAVGSASQSRWSPDFYYEMAQKVDALGVMLYDTTITNAGTFQNLVRDQVTNITRAVSGTYWSDGFHPAPTNAPLVFMGFAAYPGTTDHDPTTENITNAAMGADWGATDLINRGEFSVGYFGGAIVFKHTDGTGGDGAAGYANEWQRFQEKWLWGCEDCSQRNDPPGITSVLRVLSVGRTNNDICISWATLGGKTNLVEAAPCIRCGFEVISSPIILPGAGEVAVDHIHEAGATAPERYYRIRVLE
jgi:hypothetical protein